MDTGRSEPPGGNMLIVFASMLAALSTGIVERSTADPTQAIDTHIHLFEPVGLDWLKDTNSPLYRTYAASEFEEMNRKLPLRHAVLIEAGTDPEHAGPCLAA